MQVSSSRRNLLIIYSLFSLQQNQLNAQRICTGWLIPNRRMAWREVKRILPAARPDRRGWRAWWSYADRAFDRFS